jgi:hypothetical protein
VYGKFRFVKAKVRVGRFFGWEVKCHNKYDWDKVIDEQINLDRKYKDIVKRTD